MATHGPSVGSPSLFYSTASQPSCSTLTSSPSAKRVKSAPSPRSPSSIPSTSGSCISRGRRPYPPRPTLDDRRGVTFDRHVVTSPYRSPSRSHDARGLPRRRELSVPLLSQTLSHFSLSQSSPPFAPPPQPTAFCSPPFRLPPGPSTTPRDTLCASVSRTPAPPLPRNHVYPSTAPLPHVGSFLGSPFSSKGGTGNYPYSRDSPSKAFVGGAMSVRLCQAGIGIDELEWLTRSEWMVERSLDELSDKEDGIEGLPRPRLRRGTSGSNSSVDDLSGSGTSSASLLSLGRSSGEHHARSSFVTIWSDAEAEPENPATPSRHPFRASDGGDGLQTSSETAKGGSTFSPLLSKALRAPAQATPLRTFLSRTGSVNEDESSPSHKRNRSPLASFVPRLLSSKKISKKPHSRTPSEGVEELTDTEDTDATSSRSQRHRLTSATLWETPTIPKLDPAPNAGLGLGLGITSTRVQFQGTSITRSISSESSETNTSPSRPLSARASSLPFSPLQPNIPKSKFAEPRRKIMTGQFSAKMSSKIALPTNRGKPNRPLLRRGITEPAANGLDVRFLSAKMAHTPPAALFGDIKPSPAAFASTGLVKKKAGITTEIPKFGETSMKHKESSPATSPISPIGAKSSAELVERLVPERKKSLSSNSNSNPMGTGVQRTRGLRRKGSTMFQTSGSSGSISEVCKVFTASPATPTKPAIQLTPFGLGITTPSPRSPSELVYPFTSRTPIHARSTPASSEFNPSSADVQTTSPWRTFSPRVRELDRGPIARASNPMLATSFRAAQRGNKARQRGAPNRLQTDFKLVQSLGAGEFSQVWKVRDKEGKVWAVKAGKSYTGTKNRLRQLEEVSILRSLSLDPHPNVINFIDSWEHVRRLYIRTELVECGDLARFLEALSDSGGLGEARVWKTLVELSSALAHVHSHNLLHLDVKPSNILITSAGSLKLADFGMSTITNAEGRAADLSPALPQLEDGEFVWREEGTMPSPVIDREIEGDREYLCPEALGDEPVGRPADVYSLGILVLETALNVVLPPNGEGWINLRSDNFAELEEHYLPRPEGDYRSIDAESGMPLVSEELLRVVKGMMGSDPGARMALEDVTREEVFRRVKRAMEGGSGAALVEESDEWLGNVLPV